MPNSRVLARVLYDRGTDWLDCYPAATRSLDNTVEAFKQWAGPKEKVQSFHCDNAHELIGAAQEFGWRIATATTGVPQTNGLTERMVRKSKEGGRCSIAQARICGKRLPGEQERSAFTTTLRLLMEIPPYNQRHGKGIYKGKKIPCGAFVSFMPQPEILKKQDAFESKTMWGIFVGYYVAPGGCTQVAN